MHYLKIILGWGVTKFTFSVGLHAVHGKAGLRDWPSLYDKLCRGVCSNVAPWIGIENYRHRRDGTKMHSAVVQAQYNAVQYNTTQYKKYKRTPFSTDITLFVVLMQC